jgi:MSHA pilin protein MshC
VEGSQGVSAGRRCAGFTLTELVIVVGLVALLAAVGAPRWFGSGAFDERRFLEEVLAALRYSQKVAVATGCEVRVTTAGGGYAVAQRSACETGGFDRALSHPAGLGTAYAGSPPAGIGLVSDVEPFLFDGLGRARSAGGEVADVTLELGTRAIVVTGETGFIDAW